MLAKQKRSKIALVVPSLAQGGGVPAVARFVKDTILQSGRYDLKLVSLSTSSRDPSSFNFSQPATWRRGAITAAGIWDDLPYVHVGAMGGELEFQRYQPRKILTDVLADCDIIQVVCGSPAWANAVCGLGKPVLLQVATRVRVERRVRDSKVGGLSDLWRKAMTEVTDRLDDRALKAVDAIQVENPWMLDYAGKLNAGRKVDLRYAPPGVDAVAFSPMLPQRDLDNDPYILCVARLSDPRKKIGLLLEAYALLPQDLIGRVRLVLAGSSGPPNSFWQRADALGLRGRVSYIERPTSPDLILLYQKASVFALPSDEEGLGVVLLEAMACGVPAVSTRSGGPDGIITDELDGYLVGLDDAEGMSNRIHQLLVDSGLNRAMGINARERVAARYAQQVAGDEFVEMWDKALLSAEGVLTV